MTFGRLKRGDVFQFTGGEPLWQVFQTSGHIWLGVADRVDAVATLMVSHDEPVKLIAPIDGRPGGRVPCECGAFVGPLSVQHHLRGRIHKGRMALLETLPACETCGEPFRPSHQNLTDGVIRRFCSRACGASARGRTWDQRRQARDCKDCGATVERGKHFCKPCKRTRDNACTQRRRNETTGRQCAHCPRTDGETAFSTVSCCRGCHRRCQRNGRCPDCEAILWLGGRKCRACGWQKAKAMK